jgi:hypothetical protein
VSKSRGIRRPGRTLAERFWEKVHKVEGDGCWTWTAATTEGYGAIGIDGSRRDGAHRVSWRLHFGLIPEGMEICHHCDNRLCVRPDHLFLGTRADNMQDAKRKGRLRVQRPGMPRGSRHHHASITEDIARLIRALREEGLTYREIGERTGASKAVISQVATGKSWRHAC